MTADDTGDQDPSSDDLWVDPDPVEPAELPLVAREAEPTKRSPWVLVGGVTVLVIALLAGAWALAGRGDDDDVETGSDAAPAGADGFWGHRWQVESVEGDGAPDLGSGSTVPELFLDAGTEGRVSFTGCNGGSGPATVEGDRLVVGSEGFSSTDMACITETGPDLMAYDTWMQGLLASKPTVTVAGSRLTLASDGATLTLHRVAGPTTTNAHELPQPGASESNDPADPSHLPDPGSGTAIVPGPTVVPGGNGGGSVGSEPASSGAAAAMGQDWEVTGLVVDGTERTVVPDGDGGPIVLDLTQQDLVAFNGCNGAGGSVRVDGDRLVVDRLASTKMACGGADGEALMAQDGAIAALLEAGPAASVEGNTLTLTSSAGTLTATRIG